MTSTLLFLIPLVAQGAPPEVMFLESFFGISQVDPQTGTVLATVPVEGLTTDIYGMTHDGSRLVAIDRGPAGLPLDEIISVHPSDGKRTSLGLTGYVWNSASIEIDPTTGIYYAAHTDDLYTLDPATGAATWLGSIDGMKPFDCICGLAIDKQGNAFGFGFVDYAVYSLDLPNLSATHLGDLPFTSGVVSDAAIDSSGQLYATWRPGDFSPNGVYKVDIANLTVTPFVSTGISGGVAFGPATPEVPYCTPKTSSLGCLPSLTSAGIASPTASSGYEVTASGVQNHTNGRLIYSLAGAASNPFAGGTLCVATPWKGTPVVSSGGSPKPAQDCSGAWVADLNTELAAKPGPQPGDTLYCQWIGRDRGFAPPDNYALSSALEFTLLP
jgi:hypothetical protein